MENLLQGDEPQNPQAFHIVSCNHANEEVQAFWQAYLAAESNRDIIQVPVSLL